MTHDTARAEPESLRGRSLSASLTVDDLDASTTWYRDVMGFHVDKTYDRDGTAFGVALVAGSVSILLTQDDGAKGTDRRKGEGISLRIVTAQDVDTIAQRVEECGGTLATQPTDTPWGSRIFRVRDPNGFLLTIASDNSST